MGTATPGPPTKNAGPGAPATPPTVLYMTPDMSAVAVGSEAGAGVRNPRPMPADCAAPPPAAPAAPASAPAEEAAEEAIMCCCMAFVRGGMSRKHETRGRREGEKNERHYLQDGGAPIAVRRCAMPRHCHL